MKNYKGYALFNTDENPTTRTTNQATVMANIFEDNLNGNVITVKGGLIVCNYFGKIEQKDRQEVFKKYSEVLHARGFKEGGSQ